VSLLVDIQYKYESIGKVFWGKCVNLWRKSVWPKWNAEDSPAPSSPYLPSYLIASPAGFTFCFIFFVT